jgi:6-phosphogluconate dehydrogenase
VPTPTLAEAVFARGISSQLATRQALAEGAARPAPQVSADAGELAADLAAAIPAVSLVAHVQGLALIAAASAAQGWNIDLAAVARGWRAGCILRSALMERLARDLAADGDPMRLLRAPVIADGSAAWRRLLASASAAGIAVPVLASALAHLDGLRTARSGADLIQGMRDVFGRHGFKRTDKPGSFHADWPEA